MGASESGRSRSETEAPLTRYRLAVRAIFYYRRQTSMGLLSWEFGRGVNAQHHGIPTAVCLSTTFLLSVL